MGKIPVEWRLAMADTSIDFFSFPAYIGMIPEKWRTRAGNPRQMASLYGGMT